MKCCLILIILGTGTSFANETDSSSDEPAPITQQQGRTITGVVSDAAGPVIGANVVVKGTTNGTVTDTDGRFSISNVPSNAVLQVSYIGYLTQELNVANQTQFEITIQEDVQTLDELVVVGYGTVRRSDLTGSVGSVSAGTLENQSAPRFDQALTGQIAGVQVINGTGAPGSGASIRIRGVGSLTASTEPLYVIDGFPGADIASLNPDDIEKIDILKDASSTAIYGSRGSNGVVIISTKRGKTGKPVIRADVSYGLAKAYNLVEMLSGIEQAKFAMDGFRNYNLDRGRDVSNPDPTTWQTPLPLYHWNVIQGINNYNTNMVEEILRTAPQYRASLSVNGGNENVRFSVSGEYLKQEGIVLNSDFERLSLRTNIDAKLSERANLRLSLNPSFTNNNAQNSGNDRGGYSSNNPINRAQIWPAYLPVYGILDVEKGTIIPSNDYFISDHKVSNAVNHPVAQTLETINNSKRLRVQANAALDYKILEELQFTILAGANVYSSNTMLFFPDKPYFNHGGARSATTGSDNSSLGYNWVNSYTLNYNKSFGLHNINAVAAFEAQANWSKNSSLSSNYYPNDLNPYLNAVSQISSGSSSASEWSLLSYLARVNYNYDNRYYITGTVRTDGSSRFGRDKKYGFFPSVGLRWRVSQEAFMHDVSSISDLSLRASFGRTGNNNIGNYEHIATISGNSIYLGDVVQGYAPSGIDNPLLTWEIQNAYNFGLDLSLFKSRLSFGVEYFYSRNSDLLLEVPVPATTGYVEMMQNIGEIENRGFEVTVNTVNISNKDFSWTTNFNISTFKNKVLKMGPDNAPILPQMGANIYDINYTGVGHPVGAFYGLIHDGIFMNEAELAEGPIYGSGNSRSRVGDIRFKDISGPDGVPDGKITEAHDQTFMKESPYPDFTYGMTNQLDYKNLSLSVNLYGSYGNQIFNLPAAGVLNGRGTRVGQLAIQRNAFKSEQEPGDGIQPRANDSPTGGNRVTSARYLDTGSFLRINNVRLAYSLPKPLVSRWFNSSSLSAQIYLNVSNLYTFTKNKTAFNPDANYTGGGDVNLHPGSQFSDYPVPRTITFGLNITM